MGADRLNCSFFSFELEREEGALRPRAEFERERRRELERDRDRDDDRDCFLRSFSARFITTGRRPSL